MTLIPIAALATAAVLCNAESTPQPPVVVELFTSQGCSSCPHADRWLGTLRQRHGDRVIALSMHVGYWDYIGWKDPFARREFNERQRLLAAANGSRSVYTPGVFVQGLEAPDWWRAAPVDEALRVAQQRQAVSRATLAVTALSRSELTVGVQGEAPAGARLWLALVQDGLSTAVKAGENRGATLRNENVVRDWRGPFAVGSVTQVLGFPADAGAGDSAAWAVVALIDDARGRTLQAVHLPLARCTGAAARR